MKTFRSMLLAALLAGTYLTLPTPARADGCTDDESACIYDAGEQYDSCVAWEELAGGDPSACYPIYLENWNSCVEACYDCEGQPPLRYVQLRISQLRTFAREQLWSRVGQVRPQLSRCGEVRKGARWAAGISMNSSARANFRYYGS